jgi:transcriptional regulator with PAS, ATPase and Fis domain
MDLYYRLAVVEGAVPPLRERPEDIELLVEHFLASQSPPRTLADLPPNTLAMLRNHQWPGNVRELRNTITRLMLFPERPGFDAMPTATAQPAAQPSVMHLPLREARDLVVAEHNGNVSRAAEAMGVSRQFLHRLLERHGIDR